MRPLTPAEWQKLVNAANLGDRVTYWQLLSRAGDKYAGLALQVATDSSISGRAANRWFLHQAQVEGHTFNTYDLQNIGIDLMRRDLAFRAQAIGGNYLVGSGIVGGNFAFAPDIVPQNIYSYHQAAFAARGVSKYGWTLAPLFEVYATNVAALNWRFETFLDQNTFNGQFSDFTTLAYELNLVWGINNSIGDSRIRATELFGDFYSNSSFAVLAGTDLQKIQGFQTWVSDLFDVPFFTKALGLAFGEPEYFQPGMTPKGARLLGLPDGYLSEGWFSGDNGIGGRLQPAIFDGGSPLDFLTDAEFDELNKILTVWLEYEEQQQIVRRQRAVMISEIARIFGSTLGRQLAGENVVAGVALGSILGAVGLNIGQSVAQSSGYTVFVSGLGGDYVATSTDQVWNDFSAELDGFFGQAAIGAVSSWLTLELGQTLGLEGFGAEMFSFGVGTLLEHSLSNLAASLDAFEGIGLQDVPWFKDGGGLSPQGGAALAQALGAFIGAKLGSLVVQPQTQAGAVLGSLGTAIGSYVGVGVATGTWGASTAVEFAKIFSFGGFAGAAVGAFVGFVLGTLFGNMFGRKKPRIPAADSEVVLQIPSAKYALGTESQVNNGNLDLVRSMATGARDTLNGLIELVTHGDDRAKVSNTWSPTQAYGHTGGQLWVKLGGSSAAKTNVNSADEAVDKGVMWALPATQIIGGDLFLKRAIHNQVRHPGQAPNIAALAGDLQIAGDYAFYLQNRSIIDAAIAEPYTSMSQAQREFYNAHRAFMTRALAKASVPLQGADATFYANNQSMVDSIIADLDLTQFAAAWIITLQRAAELELNRAAPSDFYGGAKGFVDSLSLQAGEPINYETVSFSQSSVRNDFVGAEMDQGTGKIQAGWQPSGAPSIAIETIDGKPAWVARDATTSDAYYAGYYTHMGTYIFLAGDRTDNYWSVSAGQTVATAFEVKTSGPTKDVSGRIHFYDVNGNWLAHTPDERQLSTDWTRVTVKGTAPAGAVKALVEIVMWGGGDTRGPAHMVAFRNPQFNRLNAQSEDVPPYSKPAANGGATSFDLVVRADLGGADPVVSAANHMRGSELDLGTSVLGLWYPSYNTPPASNANAKAFAYSIEEVDGARAFVARAVGNYLSGGTTTYAGTFEIHGGDRNDGRWSVTPGQKISMAADFNGIQGGDYIAPYLAFYDANNNHISTHYLPGSNLPGWERREAIAVAPAGAVSFSGYFYIYGPGNQIGQTMGLAFKRMQVNFLSPSETVVPAYMPHHEADDLLFVEPNFLADTGYTAGSAGTNSAINNYVDLSTSTSSVTIDDTGGDDIFIGGTAADSLYGREGRDWIDGKAGNDNIEGNEGDDVLLGDAGEDLIYGGDGDDYISGGDGNEIWWTYGRGLWGGNGNDTLVGGRGNDQLWGEAGDDIMISDDDGGTEWDYYFGLDGNDLVSYERWSTAVNIDLTQHLPSDYDYRVFYGDYLYRVESIRGSRFNDTLKGDEGNNRLYGGAGNDVILNPGDGDDFVEGGPGADNMEWSNGFDTLSYASSSAAVWVDMTAYEAFGGDAEGDTFQHYDKIEGSKHADTLKGSIYSDTLSGLGGDDWFVASDGWDTFAGDEGFDTLDFSEFTAGGVTFSGGTYSTYSWTGSYSGIEHFVGTASPDNIYGDAADNWLQGGQSGDYLSGGAGSDTYIFHAGDGADTIDDTNANNNVLVFGDGLTWTNFWYGTSTHLTMTMGGGDQVVVNNNFATPGNNRLKFIDMGGAGSIDISEINWAAGGDNNANTVQGHSWGKDWLAGYDGNDTLRGQDYMGWEQNGNVFMGGRGDDYIIASAGDDQFVFERGHGRDSIYDAGGVDTIVFGPTVAAEDVIFGIDGNDLIIAIRDLNNPGWTAQQVWTNAGDAIRVLDGGAQIYEWVEYTSGGGGYYTGPTFTTIEHIIAGGTSIDLMKLDIPWGTATGGGAYYPIVFDLGGDGLDLISVDHSEVVIKGDDASAPMMRVGWVDGQDGMLAIDRNRDGEISRMSEISFRDELKGAKTDLEGLAALDSNGDGKLDALDERWGDLKMWRDVNQNGVGKDKEVVSLEQAGIVAIELKLTPTGFDGSDTLDNTALNTAVFHWVNGKTGTIYDVALASKLAHIDGRISGKWRPEWKAQPKDGDLGRARAPDGVSDPTLVSAKGLEYAPAQSLGFAKDDANDGKDDLPPVISKKGTIEDLEREIAARAEGKGAPPSAGSAAPIAIDLDGDGIELIVPEDSKVSFDLDQDGWMDRLGWVGPRDGLLSIDRDGDGRISLLNEISFLSDKPGATTDLEGLNAFDSDGDGALTAADAKWESFLVWRDANQDGRSTSSELVTLAEAGIRSVGLGGSPAKGAAGEKRTLPRLVEREELASNASGPLPYSIEREHLAADVVRTRPNGIDRNLPEWRGFDHAFRPLPFPEFAAIGAEQVSRISVTADPGLSNTVLGETTVQLADGRTVTALDLALGSISGIELAIRASRFDPSSLFSGPRDQYPTSPALSQWAFNPAVRRMIMGGDQTDLGLDDLGPAPVSPVAPTPASDIGLDLSGAQSLRGEQEAWPEIGTGQYGELTREQLTDALSLSQASEDGIGESESAPRGLGRQARRWWSQASYEPLPAGATPNSLSMLLSHMASHQTIAQDDVVPRGRDRAVPLDPELARNASQLRDAMAAFGPRRLGADWRQSSPASDTSAVGGAPVPSLWRRSRHETVDRHARISA